MKQRLLKLILGGLIVCGYSVPAFATPITSTADPALNGATTITYETETPGNFSFKQIGNVIITGIGGYLTISNDDNGQFVPPQDKFLDNRTSGTPFSFQFINPVRAFGMAIGATNAPQFLLAYNIYNNLIETVMIPNQVNSMSFPYAGFYGIATSTPSIAKVVLTSYNNDWIVTDDLKYSIMAPVPEPSTLLLLGSGIGGLAFMMRRFGRG